MTEQQYRAIGEPFRRSAKLKKALLLYNKIVTLVFAGAYLTTVVVLFALRKETAIPCTVVPAAGFAFTTALRYLVNRKRPYEVFDVEPLLPKKTSGKSMPSRHLFSAFAIAVVFFRLHPAAGIVAFVFAAGLGYARIALGVHFLSDVLVGAALGVLLTALGIYLPFWGWTV